jgi:DNA-binding response OmpR family regulator
MDRATVVKSDWMSGRSIMVVDDDPIVVKAMRVLLHAEGFKTVECQTGSEAMRVANENISAAVLDIHLPDISGLSLSRQLRGIFKPDVPIIILSGDNSIETLRALPDAGATYFFAKPVNTGMLMSKLKEWTA